MKGTFAPGYSRGGSRCWGRVPFGRPVLKSFLVYIPLTALCIASFQLSLSVEFPPSKSNPPFHGDESTWLANTRAFWRVVQGDFDSRYWSSYDGWTQPHAGHYVYALVLRAAGITPDMLHKRCVHGKSTQWNFLHGRIPSKKVLLTGRRFSALCGALACILLCEIGRRVFGWLVGLVAACWLALNPLMRYVCQRAMIDGQVSLALVAGILLMLVLFGAWQRRAWWSVLLISVGVGAFFGLTAGLKINGGVLCAIAIASLPFYGLGLYLQSHRGERPVRPPLKGMLTAVSSVAIVCSAAMGTFYGLNPQMWPVGIYEGAKITIDLRQSDVAGQQVRHSYARLTSSAQRIGAAADMYFVQWPTLRWSPIGDFQSAHRAGAKRHGLWPIEGFLFLTGLVGLAGALLGRARREHRIDGACIIALWLGVYSAFVFLMVPLLWPRYYQKYLPLQALLVGIGVWTLIELLRRVRSMRRCGSGDSPSKAEGG